MFAQLSAPLAAALDGLAAAGGRFSRGARGCDSKNVKQGKRTLSSLRCLVFAATALLDVVAYNKNHCSRLGIFLYLFVLIYFLLLLKVACLY